MRANIKNPEAIVRTAIANVIESAKRNNQDSYEAAAEVLRLLEELQVSFRPIVRRARNRA